MVIEVSLVVIWAAIQIPLGIWLFRAKPSKDVAGKYSKTLVFQSTLPFFQGWRNKLHDNDKEAFEEYRRRAFIQFYGGIVTPLILFYVYLYFKYIHFE